METSAHLAARRPKWMLPALLLLGTVVLLGTWSVLYWTESLFTESHLVGYYCCATESDLSPPGTLERTFSDFFRTSPASHLPSLLLVGANLGLFAISLRRGGWYRWWLPWVFITFNILYFVVDIQLLTFSWSISDRLVGPQTSAYKGYERTWYGIVLHLVLWMAYFTTLVAVLRGLLPESKELEKADR